MYPAALPSPDQPLRVFLEAAGSVSELIQPPQASVVTFTLTPLQYVSVYHNKLGPGARPCLPLSCEVQDSPRWSASTKPRPRPGKIITVSGFLERVIRTEAGGIDKMVIAVDQVIYIADGTPPSSALDNTLGEPAYYIGPLLY